MKKILLKSIIILFLFLPIIAFAHLLVFPQETRCILIDFSDFKKIENIYYRPGVSAATIDKLLQLKLSGEKKVNSFWGSNTMLNYKLIYCEDSIDFERYGSTGSPAVTHIKLGAYVVIPKDMFDENILAHEISHTVLYRNIGWYNRTFKIPAWFDEGLAMQVDERSYYSIDSLLRSKVLLRVLSEVMQIKTPEKFYEGTREKIMMNYRLSKYIVYEWLKTHSIYSFVDAINKGESFSKAYKKIIKFFQII